MRRMLLVPILVCGLAIPAPAFGQSEHALRFHGTGAGGQDRALVVVDDDLPGPDGNTPLDVGGGDFTLECWIRGELADNTSAGTGGDLELHGDDWLFGNVLVDRSVLGSGRDFGLGVAGGHVRFGTGGGDQGGESPCTIEGDTPVLDGIWHHVAAVRDAGAGTLSIYVDGLLDFVSSAGVSRADLSYPDEGRSGQDPLGPVLAIGAEKHDTGPAQPSFAGFVDELRVFATARSAAQIAESRDRVLPPDLPGLVAVLRFEEGTGTELRDSSFAGSPAATLVDGVPGNGEWVHAQDDPANTAPIDGERLPPDYRRVTVLQDLDRPVSMDFAPDGSLYLAQVGGEVLRVVGDVLQPTPVIVLSVDDADGERGLLSIALDPDFAQNGFLYTYATTPEPRNGVRRFTVVDGVADPASEFVVWENEDPVLGWHQGGALVFDDQDHLFVATGDQFTAANAQDLSVQHGKVLRLHRDGRVPADNPYVGVPGVDPAIYASGLRNPFRATRDPVSGRIWIGDVGANAQHSFEELDVLHAAANFGWPNAEGPECYASDCSAYTRPVLGYAHDDPDYAMGAVQGCVVLGAVARGTAFPVETEGDMFFADYAGRWISRLVLEPDGVDDGSVPAEVFAVVPFASPATVGGIVDLRFGPDGALWFLTFGSEWGGGRGTAGLHRIESLGDGNRPPVAVATAAPDHGTPPLRVQFSSAGSHDPDGGPGPLGFSWTFGDGTTSSAADPLHDYPARGVYDAVLEVDDGDRSTRAAPLRIEVGHPPRIRSFAPPPGTNYRAGDTIAFSASADDAEDGPLAPAAFEWTVLLLHAEHTHPFASFEGMDSGQFTIPVDEHPPEHTRYRVDLNVRDSDGLSAERSRTLMPLASPLRFESDPPGVRIVLDDETRSAPFDLTSLVGFEHSLAAPEWIAAGERILRFRDWSQGGGRTQTYVAPDSAGRSPPVLRARYELCQITRVVVPLDRREANGQYHDSGKEAYRDANDPHRLRIGRDDFSVAQAGFLFEVPVPRDAVIVSAVLELTAANLQKNFAEATVFRTRSPQAPWFDEQHTHHLTEHAALDLEHTSHWVFPRVADGEVLRSPELSPLLQAAVDDRRWNSGARFGLVLDGSVSLPGSYLTVRNFDHGAGARLVVEFLPPVR